MFFHNTIEDVLMKKIFALMIAVAFGMGTLGCDDKKAPATSSKAAAPKMDETKKPDAPK